MTNGSKRSKTYSAPKLVVYGDMVKFTASGSAGDAENQGGQPSKKA